MSDATTDDTRPRGGPLAPARPASGGPIAPGTHPWRDWAPARRTLTGFFDHVTTHRADDLLLSTPHADLTGADLRGSVLAGAAYLRSLGVAPGDRVSVVCENRIEQTYLLFATSWVGAVLASVNPALRGESLTHQLRLAGPAVVVTDAAGAARVAASVDELMAEGRDRPRLVLATGPRLDDEPGPAGEGAADIPRSLGLRAEHWTRWAPPALDDAQARAVEPHPVSHGDVGTVLYTSGTTGPAKGVMLSQAQLFHWGIIGCEELSLVADDVLYTCLPLFHTNALTTPLQAWAAGGRAILGPRFSVSRFWQRLSEAGATVTFVLGAMSTMLWSRRPEKADLPPLRLRTVLGGGMPPALKEPFEEFTGARVAEGFGMTELGVPLYTPLDRPAPPGSMGVAHPDYEVKVVDVDETEVPRGTTGELVVRARRPFGISLGYWGNPAATVEAWQNLWFHTGDLVVQEEDDSFRYVDRLKDSIRRRGENISSYDVEAAFARNALVDQVAAVAVPSPLGEDEVLVAVVLTDAGAAELAGTGPAAGGGADVDVAGGPAAQWVTALVRGAEPHLPYFAVPRYVRVVTAMPLTANGKISKQQVRDQGVPATTWDAEAVGFTATR